MYHLLIERVSTVTIEFLQYRARVRVRIGLNRVGCQTDWFIYIPRHIHKSIDPSNENLPNSQQLLGQGSVASLQQITVTVKE